MEVTISYEFDPNYPDNPYWARAEYCGKPWLVCGTSFENAKARLLSKISKLPPEVPIIPEPEVVEFEYEQEVAHVS